MGHPRAKGAKERPAQVSLLLLLLWDWIRLFPQETVAS
jgi:hypothetical protein